MILERPLPAAGDEDDLLDLRFRTVRLPKDPACPACGPSAR